MTLAGTPRPASGAEHDLSHFWEIKALESGQIPEFHGKTVAVATVLVNRVYHLLAETEQIFPRRETLNWERIDAVYGPAFSPQVHEFQHPPITDSVSLPLLAVQVAANSGDHPRSAVRHGDDPLAFTGGSRRYAGGNCPFG